MRLSIEREKIFNILKELNEDNKSNTVYYKGICIKKVNSNLTKGNQFKIFDTCTENEDYVEIRNLTIITLILRRVTRLRKCSKRMKRIKALREKRRLLTLKQTAPERTKKRSEVKNKNKNKKVLTKI